MFNFRVFPLVPVQEIPVVWFRALVARAGRLSCTRVTAPAAIRTAACAAAAAATASAGCPRRLLRLVLSLRGPLTLCTNKLC